MKRGSTLFLKFVVGMIGLVVLGICTFGLPQLIISELTTSDFDYGPIFLGLYVPAVPFFIALYQAIKLLNNIEKDIAFSLESLKALKIVKYAALTISGLFALGMPYIFIVADRDDAPGVVALGLVIIFASLIVATATAVFQSLMESALDLKSENDLTV